MNETTKTEEELLLEIESPTWRKREFKPRGPRKAKPVLVEAQKAA